MSTTSTPMDMGITGTPITGTPITGAGVTEAIVAPALSWEPCLEAGTTDEDGLCAGCGWPPDEHGGTTGPGREAVLPNVVTIRVPQRPRLRKAS